MARTSTGAVALVAALALALVGAPAASADTGSGVGAELVTLSGTVTDLQTGLPIAGVDVDAYNTDVDGVRVDTHTDANGVYAFQVPPSDYYVSFVKLDAPDDDAYLRYYYPGTYDSEETIPVRVTNGQDRTGVDIALPKASKLSGKVTLAGKPLPSGVVEVVGGGFDGGSFYADISNGRYTATVPAFTYSLLTSAYGYASSLATYYGNTVRRHDAKYFSVGVGEHLSGLDIAVKAGATTKGIVRNSKGKPVKGVVVDATNVTREGWDHVTTDAKGAYVLTGLPTGNVRVRVTQSHASATTTVAAVQGKTISAKTLVLRRPGSAAISGAVAVKSGIRSNVKVSLLNSKKAIVRQLKVSSTGRVKFKDLAAGRYTVVLGGANTAKTITVRSGRTVSFGTLTRGKQSELKGVVRAPSGKVATWGAKVTLWDAYGTYAGTAYTDDVDGSYSIKGLVRGTYTVRADDSLFGRLATEATTPGATTFTVKAGKGATKSIRLNPAGTLTGVVKNSKGKPVKGIWVLAGGDGVQTGADGVYVLDLVAVGKRLVHTYDEITGGYVNASTTATAKAGKTVKVPTITVH